MSNKIIFEIEQTLKRTDSENIVDLSQGYLKAEFQLGEEWANDDYYNKYALFRRGELSSAQELTRMAGGTPKYECEV